jgi:NAD+ diphosphatase
MPPTFVRTYPPARPEPGPALWLLLQDGKLLVTEHNGQLVLPAADDNAIAALLAEEPLFLGTLDGTPCLAAAPRADAAPPDGWQAVGLRALYGRTDESVYGLAGYAAQLLEWRRTSRFCPVCGGVTGPVAGDWGRRCTACSYTRYPPVSPAILALVHDGDRILLTHKPGWGPMFSLIAGFVEPGESLEECVVREVREEVGVDVADVRYDGSQPWPFPHQVMIGFTARYAGGDIRPDALELDDARWFDIHDLPALPAPLSLSRQLIDRWVKGRLQSAACTLQG